MRLSSKSIEVISHCYAMEHPHFAQALKYHLSSLEMFATVGGDVMATVCYCREDKEVVGVLEWFQKNTKKLKMRGISLDKKDLSWRAIGRNIAALHTKASVVWFSDVDQTFEGGILGTLSWMKWPEGAVMLYPTTIMIARDHATGDEILKESPLHRRYVRPEVFVHKQYNRAIGGVQIVPGEFTRKHGYLQAVKGCKHLRPTEDGLPFRSFKDDIAYRKFCQKYGRIVGIDLPGLHRIRHSTTTYQEPKHAPEMATKETPAVDTGREDR